MTKKYNPKHYYTICNRIREIIDRGDELINRQALEKQEGLGDPINTAFMKLTVLEAMRIGEHYELKEDEEEE